MYSYQAHREMMVDGQSGLAKSATALQQYSHVSDVRCRFVHVATAAERDANAIGTKHQ